MQNILFVEDDANIVEIYRECLVREGFEVSVAEDGIAAMKSLHRARPDLVILDLMMPKLNGADVLKFIRTDPGLKHTKVVIFTNATPTTCVALNAEKIGADAFLSKLTCTPEQLVNVVKTLLSNGHSGEEHSRL